MQFGKATIVHGDRTLVVVEQGRIGYALDKGQPVLLPPGMHQWQSSTQIFEKLYDLNNNLVRARQEPQRWSPKRGCLHYQALSANTAGPMCIGA